MKRFVVFLAFLLVIALLVGCNDGMPVRTDPRGEAPATDQAPTRPTEPDQSAPINTPDPAPAATTPSGPITVAEFAQNLPDGWTRYTAQHYLHVESYSNDMVRVLVEIDDDDGFFLDADGGIFYSVKIRTENIGHRVEPFSVTIQIVEVMDCAIIIADSTSSYTPSLAIFLYGLMEGTSAGADTALGLSPESIQELSKTQDWLDGEPLNGLLISIEGVEQRVSRAIYQNNIFRGDLCYYFNAGAGPILATDIAGQVTEIALQHPEGIS